MISIIIPHYNSAELLKENLLKLDNQTNKNFEVIVVDDCSSDDEYCRLLDGIEVSYELEILRNTVNLGPGGARNKGIVHSKGEYITFLDADDYYEDDFIEEMMNVISSENVDAITFNYNYVSDKSVEHSIYISKDIKEGFVDVKEALVFVRGATLGKCYKKDVIMNNNVVFLPLKRNEDMPFTKIAIANCSKIYHVDKAFYNYVCNESSIMHNINFVNEENERAACQVLRERLGEMFPVELSAILHQEYIYSTIFTKIQLKKPKREILKFIDENKITFTKYDFKFPLYLRVILLLIKTKCYIGLRFMAYLKKII